MFLRTLETFFVLIIFSFFVVNLYFYHFHFFFDKVLNFRNTILRNLKQELVIRNFQWNCMLVEEIPIATEIGTCMDWLLRIFYGKSTLYLTNLFMFLTVLKSQLFMKKKLSLIKKGF